MTSSEKTVEKDFSMFFMDPRAELKKLNEEEANTHKKKKQVVIDLAKRLELEEVPLDKICMIIIKNIQDLLKPRTIREYLPVNYKLLHKVVNAKKQKSKQPEPLDIHDLAALPPLNH